MGKRVENVAISIFRPVNQSGPPPLSFGNGTHVIAYRDRERSKFRLTDVGTASKNR